MNTGGSKQRQHSNAHAAFLAKEFVFAVAAMALALVGFILVSGFRPSYITALWGHSDAILEYATSKGIQEMGLGNYNDLLGFPWGQDWSHFPALDPANRIEMFLLGLVWEPVTALNILMIISFPLVAGLMYAALRNLQISRTLALVGGVSLSLVGYHFDYEHPLLSNYWVIPVGIVWLSYLLNVPTHLSTRCTSRLVVTIGVLTGLMIGLNNPQYAFFFIILGTVALLFRWNARGGLLGRGLRLLVLVTPVAVLGLSLVLTQLSRRIPAVAPTAERSVQDSYLWAGKFISLFTISGESPLSANPINSRLQEALETTVWTGTTALSNAVVVAASLFVLLFSFFVIFNTKRKPGGWVHKATGRTAPWAGLWIVGALFFVTSGLGVMFAALVTPQVRSWTRIGIVLAAIALTAAALFLDSCLRTLRESGNLRARAVQALILGGLALLVVDGFLARSALPANASTKPALESLVNTGEQSLAPDCTILNVPTLAFPEAVPKGSMEAYDHLLPYLASSEWRFSYGGIKGQLGSRWTDHLSVNPTEKAQQARSAGFCAMLVDRLGLDASSASLEQYVEALGEPIAVALDRWYLFDLGGNPKSADQAEIFTKPEVNYGKDFTREIADEAAVVSRWTRSEVSAFRVWNPSNSESELIMSLGLTAAECSNEQSVDIRVGGDTRRKVALKPGQREEIRIPLAIPARSSTDVELVTPSPRCEDAGQIDVGVRMEDARFTKATDPDGVITFVSGYWDSEIDVDGSLRRWGDGPIGELEVINTDSDARTAVLSVDLQAPPCGAPQAVTIDINGKRALSQALTPGQSLPISLPVPLDGFGTSIVRLTSDSPGCTVSGDARNLGVALINPTLR